MLLLKLRKRLAWVGMASIIGFAISAEVLIEDAAKFVVIPSLILGLYMAIRNVKNEKE